ncbi:MAG: transglutaminase family protein [Acidobacteria bacterium]|nr:transglutaminase family protein [Acidobacteriota bacterium]
MAYSVRHITHFQYSPAVRESVMEVRMQPRTDFRQRCLSYSLTVEPRANVMLYRDFYGNAVHSFDIPERHESIEVMAQAIVDVLPTHLPDPAGVEDWDELDRRVAQTDYWEMMVPSHFATPSPLLENLAEELNLRRRGNPLELLRELNARLYEKFDYAPNTTEVDSPIDDALQSRRGVCQDFAHIMITLVRQLKIPCRYVSGYLYHEDKSMDRSPAGATHAWVEAYLGELGWVAFDPTNNLEGCDRHVRVALGRDYADVPPTRGVYKGEAESELSVMVTVTPVDAPEPEELPPTTVMRTRFRNAEANAEAEQQQQQQQQQ